MSEINAMYLLRSDLAAELYFQCAESLPVIDYHNHLSATEIVENREYENITQMWIACDPYKHRAMRIAGVPERLITGYADDREKFDAWIGTIPKLIGNPLDQWTRLELARVFRFEGEPTRERADALWNMPLPTPRELLKSFRVETLMPSVGPGELLTPFEVAKDRLLVPSLRVADSGDSRIPGALDVFERLGCRMADHTLDADWRFRPDDPLVRLAGEYRRLGWTLQLHLGARRETSARLRKLAGPAGGYATIGSPFPVGDLCMLLDAMERADSLPPIVLYNLNPADNAAFACLTGSFAEDGVEGKIQFGPAWWYNDHYSGIADQLEHLAAYGLLSVFIGMTTDSRSLLSLARHKYFRRVFCDWLAAKSIRGLVTDDTAALKTLVRAVCYDNIKKRIRHE